MKDDQKKKTSVDKKVEQNKDEDDQFSMDIQLAVRTKKMLPATLFLKTTFIYNVFSYGLLLFFFFDVGHKTFSL